MAKHFAFFSMPAHGHVNPTLPLVAELVRRGHRVSYATGEEFHAQVRAAGAEPVAAPFTLPDVPKGGIQFDTEEFLERIGAFVDSVTDTFPVLLEHYAADRPDVICADAMTSVAPLVARKLELPFVYLHPSHASNEQFNVRQSFMENADTGGFEKMREAFEKVTDQVRAFAESQGITGDVDFLNQIAELNLVFVPREFQFSGETFDERFVFLGPAVEDRVDSGTWRSPGDPLLFISLGTVFNAQEKFYRTCLEAFGDTEWRVAMSIGEQVDKSELGAIPANVEVRDRFPQLDVLRSARAFVSHTGMNSTMEALYFGVPLISCPQQPEQAANGRRAAELGYGTVLDQEGLTAESLRETVNRTAGDPGIRTRLAEISGTLQAHPAAAAGADALLAFTS
ncbi:macrolide family glycosyltransferase [Sciscionella marina]|uniref:macrolide family glycosyltransferase n=1 Tax=Sciscionella marina TaxID=508770 RepID=UPI000370DBED|nr:macrolide family glycosyltransferase [Sciscionella marina]